MKQSPRPQVEALEDRALPAVFGFAWPDAQHLTVSFLTDGTTVSSTGIDHVTSSLTQKMQSQFPSSDWQLEILRALQAWAVEANVNFGLVSEFASVGMGSAGAIQGDPRFGDLRIAAAPLSASSIANGIPYLAEAGTWSGDLILNSGATFQVGVEGSGYDLFSIALHEAGHALGIKGNTDNPDSVMFEWYGVLPDPESPGQFRPKTLTNEDITPLVNLYGARKKDAFETADGNQDPSTAGNFKTQALKDFNAALETFETAADASGVVKLALEADITTRTTSTTSADVDYYRWKTTANNPNFTVRLQTGGLSLLTAKLEVYTAAGTLVGSDISVDPRDGELVVSVANATASSDYYIRVAGDTSHGLGTVFGVGAYRLKVEASNDNADNAFEDALTAYNPTANDTQATATELDQRFQNTNRRYDYFAEGNIATSSDVDYYKVVAPASTSTFIPTLTVQVWSRSTDTAFPPPPAPRITILDGNGQVVSSEVVGSDAERGYLGVRLLNTTPGGTYYVKVEGAPAADPQDPPRTGAYALGLDFTKREVNRTPRFTGTLDESDTSIDPQDPNDFSSVVEFKSMTLAQTQLLHLEFNVQAVTTLTNPMGAQVYLYTKDPNNVGELIQVGTWTVNRGQVVRENLYLPPGDYLFAYVGWVGPVDENNPNEVIPAMPDMTFEMVGITLSDPIGPPLVDVTQPPPRQVNPTYSQTGYAEMIQALRTFLIANSNGELEVPFGRFIRVF